MEANMDTNFLVFWSDSTRESNLNEGRGRITPQRLQNLN